MKPLSIVFLIFTLIFSKASAGEERSLFFSEYISSGWVQVLEIFNPTADTIKLNRYSIVRNGSFRFDFPGGTLLPYSTWVGCRNDGNVPPNVLAAADTSWPAAGSIWFMGNNHMIELLKDGLVIDVINGDPRNANVAGVTGALEGHTLIRKSSVLKGETSWDVSRGTNADNSQWLVNPLSYGNLGTHTAEGLGISRLIVSADGMSLASGLSEVDFGSIPAGNTLTKNFILKNSGDTDLVIREITSSNPSFSLSASTFMIEPGESDTLRMEFSPVEEIAKTSEIRIVSNNYNDSVFIFLVKGSGLVTDSDTVRFYVSPGGLDTNSGSVPEEPLRTIQAALEKVAAMNRPAPVQLPPITAPDENPILSTPDDYRETIHAQLPHTGERVEIHLMPGYHFPDSRLTINNTVGGNIHFIGHWAGNAETHLKAAFETHGRDPSWMALPVDMVPVVSGGRLVTGWRDTTVNGVSAWVTDLPDVASGNWYFKQLFVNGKRATRSRFPKTGTFRVVEPLIPTTGETTKLTDRARLRTKDVKNWKNLTDVEMVFLHRWVDERIPVKFLNASTGVVTLEYATSYAMEGSHPVHGAGESAYFWDHVFETMNQPGEWYLDKPSGRLYYIPETGQSKESTEVIAPKLKSLFSVSGTGHNNQYIWNVSFQGIGFMHTESVLQDHIGTGNANNYGDGAVSFESARIPVVKACFFAHLGEVAISLKSGTMGGEISSNVFRDLGSGAIGVFQTTSSVAHYMRTGYHHLKDNDILGYGRFYFGDVAIRHLNIVHMLVEHNYIRDGYFNAITLNATRNVISNWGYKNVLRKNKIHHTGKGELSDFGAIYLVGYMPYSSVDNNLIYNSESRDYGGSPIYLDDNAAHFTITNNIFYNSNEDIVEEKSHFNLFENNIFAFTPRAVLYSHQSFHEILQDVLNLGIKPTEFNRNIFLQNGGKSFFRGPNTDTHILFQHKGNHNLYWDYAIPDQEMNEGQSFAQWKSSTGEDANSVIADPNFMDPFRGDFRFPGESPATALGFVEIDMSDVGPRKLEWLKAGAVWFDYPAEPAKPDFLPSQIPGLHMWVSAKDIFDDRVSRWEDRTANRFSFYQFDADFKPWLIQGGLNGYPVVNFDGNTWMSSDHKSLKVSGSFGLFREDDFAIFILSRSNGDQNVIISKGGQGVAGSWSVGLLQNQFQWGTGNYAGLEGNEFTIRAFRRVGDSLQCFVNGELDGSATKTIQANFNNDWVQYYLGRMGGTELNKLNGDIAEILIYRGTLGKDEMDRITTYLHDEWGIWATDVNENETFSGLNVFPNPAREHVNISGLGSFHVLKIYDSGGLMVGEFRLAGEEMVEIPVARLRPGFYLVVAESPDGNKQRVPLMKL